MMVSIPKVIQQFESRGYQHLGGEEPNSTSIQELIAELKAFYLNYFDENFIEDRIALPADYEQFLTEFQGYFYKEGWAAFYGIDTIVERTEAWYKYWDFDYEDRKEAGELKADDTLWLNFGHWSDKHEMVLCVDKTSRYFGNVIDTRAHPFLHGSIYIDGFYDSFKTYAEDHEETYEEE
jgi:hypothetical protein